MEKGRLSAAFQKYQWLWKACLMALLPLLCAVVLCRAQGFSLGRVSLPAAKDNSWNDELFYFKQVEGILRSVIPLGYFGYNESHALIGSFGAWSPVLYLPWVLWGLLFSWTYMSPIYCNIALMSMALFCFTLLSRPTGRQTAAMAALFCLFVPGHRFMLSAMGESTCIALSILFYGFAVGYLRHGEQGWKLAGMFAISIFLTLIRPYMLLFLLLPVYLWIKRGRRDIKRVVLAAAIPMGTLGCYGVISHYLQAGCFTQSFTTDWIVAFLRGDLAGGLHMLTDLLSEQKTDLAIMVRRGLRSGVTPGTYYICFAAILATAALVVLGAARRRDRQALLLYGHLIFSFIGTLAAICLLYQLRQGGRLMLDLIGAGLLLVSLAEDRFPWKSALLAAVLILFFTEFGLGPQDFAIPHENAAREETLAYWTQAMGERMPLEGDAPGYENTVIWVYSDYVPENDSQVEMDWPILYAVPAGFGINCCLGNYVRENFDALQSRYIATVAGGQIDEMCLESGYEELGRFAGTVCYIRY